MSLTQPDKSPLIPRVPFTPTVQKQTEMLEDKLIEAEDALDDATPGTDTLISIDMLGETLQLFRRTKRLLHRAMVPDSGTPMNQQAQVVNSLGSLLKQLAALQIRLYDSERLKKLETSLIEMLQSLPKEQQDLFLGRYKELLNA